MVQFANDKLQAYLYPKFSFTFLKVFNKHSSFLRYYLHLLSEAVKDKSVWGPSPKNFQNNDDETVQFYSTLTQSSHFNTFLCYQFIFLLYCILQYLIFGLFEQSCKVKKQVKRVQGRSPEKCTKQWEITEIRN